MSSLFNINAVPPTQREIDVARDSAQKGLRLVQRLRMPLTALVFIGTAVQLWVMTGFAMHEKFFTGVVICGLFATGLAAWFAEVMAVLGRQWMDDIRALAPGHGIFLDAATKLARHHREIERYFHAIGNRRVITNGEYEAMKEMVRVSRSSASAPQYLTAREELRRVA